MLLLHLAAAPSVLAVYATAAACGIVVLVQLGDAGPSAGLIQCERTLCVRRGQVAVHSHTPAVAARMPPAAMLVINLRIGAAADCCC